MDPDAGTERTLSLHIECHLDGKVDLAYGMTDVEPEVPLETVVPSNVWDALPPEDAYKTHANMTKALSLYVK